MDDKDRFDRLVKKMTEVNSEVSLLAPILHANLSELREMVKIRLAPIFDNIKPELVERLTNNELDWIYNSISTTFEVRKVPSKPDGRLFDFSIAVYREHRGAFQSWSDRWPLDQETIDDILTLEGRQKQVDQLVTDVLEIIYHNQIGNLGEVHGS